MHRFPFLFVVVDGQEKVEESSVSASESSCSCLCLSKQTQSHTHSQAEVKKKYKTGKQAATACPATKAADTIVRSTTEETEERCCLSVILSKSTVSPGQGLTDRLLLLLGQPASLFQVARQPRLCVSRTWRARETRRQSGKRGSVFLSTIPRVP